MAIVKMNKSTRGANDGIHVKTYEAGEEYDVCDDLANVFVNVLEVAEFKASKGVVSAPENKMNTGEKLDKAEEPKEEAPKKMFKKDKK